MPVALIAGPTQLQSIVRPSMVWSHRAYPRFATKDMSNSTETVQAFPLQWPAGWRRCESHQRERARFSKRVAQRSSHIDQVWMRKQELSIAEATTRVLEELQRMGIGRDDIVISSNLRLRLDGLPASAQSAPKDPGTVVYWRSGTGTRCMAIDRYDRVQDNLAAIAATLDAMRSIERHGGATILDRAFQGFVALPAPRAWWQVLELKEPNPTRAEIEAAHRRLAMKHHPDRGGDADRMSDINAARDQGLAAL